ncbi:hypothetical protein NKJ72_29795 [Mesorhizobium sp. M0045]|uniref:hypothetical protein n=1 Tax=Mesorhizobium sp. M0045 TaxID=2956857 RepID=UPI00333D2CD5
MKTCSNDPNQCNGRCTVECGVAVGSFAASVAGAAVISPAAALVPVAWRFSLRAALMFAPLMTGKWWDIACFAKLSPVLDLLKLRKCALPRSGSRSGLAHVHDSVGGSHCDFDELARYVQLFLRFPGTALVQAGRLFLINKYIDFRRLEGTSPLAVPAGRAGSRRAFVFDHQIRAYEMLAGKHPGSSSCE